MSFFQSYLQGIEMRIRIKQAQSLFASNRTYKELKQNSGSMAIAYQNASNRTYKELKLLLMKSYRSGKIFFQSYLQGIEICQNGNFKSISPSSNRTYKELKSAKNWYQLLYSANFQSYLQGIEIEKDNILCGSSRLPIVPTRN